MFPALAQAPAPPPQMQQPPPQLGYAPQGTPPQQYGMPHSAMPQPRGPGGKSKMPLIVVGGLVVVGGIVAIVFATKGGGGAAAGTPRGVVERTLASMSAGNVNALIDLSGMDKIYSSALKCDGDSSEEQRKTLGEELVEFQRRADKAKGLKLELVDMPDLDKRDKDKDDVVATGSKFSAACTTTTELRMVKPMITVKVTHGDKAQEEKVKFGLIAIADRWYMLDPPKFDPPTRESSTTSAGSGSALRDAMFALRDLVKRMCDCKDAACKHAVKADYEKWKTTMPDVELNDDDQRLLGRGVLELRECEGGDSKSASSAPKAPLRSKPASDDDSGDLPEECDEWKQQIDNLSTCDKVTPQVMDAQRQAYTRSTAAWGKLPAASKAQLAASCRQLADGIAKMRREMCPDDD